MIDPPETQHDRWRRRSWFKKLGDAASGVATGAKGQRSFYVHLPVALAVLVAAVALQMDLTQWSILVLCIAMVLSAELMNSSIEALTRAITSHHDLHVQKALNISSGAVLIASLGAAIVGASILGYRLIQVIAI